MILNGSNERTVGSVKVEFKPNRPGTYNGKRDFLAINTWLYKVEQYLLLIQIGASQGNLSEGHKVMFASTFLTKNATVWLYTLVLGNKVPQCWEDFKKAIQSEFVPQDHVRRARDRLRKLHQTTNVSKYISEFRNLILTIPDITEGEKFDKFLSGLKYEVRVEVMKSTVATFERAAHIAIRVDSAIWGAGSTWNMNVGGNNNVGGQQGPTPMEIGNVRARENNSGKPRESQRERDIRLNACFRCHKIGCRPNRCTTGRINNVQVDEQGTPDSETCLQALANGSVKRVSFADSLSDSESEN